MIVTIDDLYKIKDKTSPIVSAYNFPGRTLTQTRIYNAARWVLNEVNDLIEAHDSVSLFTSDTHKFILSKEFIDLLSTIKGYI